MGDLKVLTEKMAQAVVSKEEQVTVEEVNGVLMTVLELSVAPEDKGRVIGKQGRIANAMRTVLRTSAAKDGKRVNLEII